MTKESLQYKIDSSKNGDVLEIPYGEFHESIIIKKPITIKGDRYPIAIAGGSPTVTIQSKDVVLDNVHIINSEDDGVCLSVQKDCKPNFKDVYLKGKVQGLEDEEGEWEIPNSLELSIIPEKTTINKFIISTPVPIKIYSSNLDDITCHPDKLQTGINEVEINIKEIRRGLLIHGDLVIETLRNKLMRKIAVSGNTINEHVDTSTFDGKLIWECESNEIGINTVFLKNIPTGRLGNPYEFIVNIDDGDNCDISVDNLPDGLRFNSTIAPHKIQGIPRVYGSFNLKWMFKINEKEYERTAKLVVEDKIPLKIEKLPDPIIIDENKPVNIQCKVVSSNSSDITYQLTDKLPRGLIFDDKTGIINGLIADHGKYKVALKISDGASDLVCNLNIFVLPEKPLKVNMEKIYRVYQKRDLVIPIVIENAEKLSPKVKLKNQPDKIYFDDTSYHIKGILNDVKDYKFAIEVIDTYNRSITESLCIKCIDEPQIVWNTPDTIEVAGIRGTNADCQIMATIIGNQKAQLKYSCISNMPHNIQLHENGFLNIKILYNKSEKVMIKAEYEVFFSEKEFKVETKIKKELKKSLPGTVFNEYDQNQLPEYSFKDQLKEGKVSQPYKDTCLTNSKGNNKDINIILTGLPNGLKYNAVLNVIEGIPQEDGIFTISIVDNNKLITKKILLKISKELFEKMSKPKDKDNTTDMKNRGKDTSLGSAFKTSYETKADDLNKHVSKSPESPSKKEKKENQLGGAFGNYKKTE